MTQGLENGKKIIKENYQNIKCFLANDNSNGQMIISGRNVELEKFSKVLKDKKIKNIRLPVSGPFHSELMREATIIMNKIIDNQIFKLPEVKVVSNVTADVFE